MKGPSEELEETIKDLDVPEGEAEDVKGGRDPADGLPTGRH